jgi:hypothetical protein
MTTFGTSILRQPRRHGQNTHCFQRKPFKSSDQPAANALDNGMQDAVALIHTCVISWLALYCATTAFNVSCGTRTSQINPKAHRAKQPEAKRGSTQPCMEQSEPAAYGGPLSVNVKEKLHALKRSEWRKNGFSSPVHSRSFILWQDLTPETSQPL